LIEKEEVLPNPKIPTLIGLKYLTPSLILINVGSGLCARKGVADSFSAQIILQCRGQHSKMLPIANFVISFELLDYIIQFFLARFSGMVS